MIPKWVLPCGRAVRNCYRMSRSQILLIAGLAALAGCATIELPKESARGNESFQFFNPDVENLPEFADRSVEAARTIQQELRARLTAAGLTETGENPDFLVAYLIVLQNNTVTTAIHDYYANSGTEILQAAHEAAVKKMPDHKFQAGTVVVDVIDTAKQKLVYRDYATREIVPGQAGEERLKLVREATGQAIAKFLD